MKVKLLHDTRVNYPAGQELEVSAQEAERLLAFGLAVPVKATVKKASTKKKEG